MNESLKDPGSGELCLLELHVFAGFWYFGLLGWVFWAGSHVLTSCGCAEIASNGPWCEFWMLWWYLYLKLQALPTMLQEKWVTCSVIFQAEKTNNQCEAVPKKDRIVRVKLPLRGGKWTFDLFQAEKLKRGSPTWIPSKHHFNSGN